METFVYKDKKLLRCGYTTGACAALAARAAVLLLITGAVPKRSMIRTPSGKEIEAMVEHPVLKVGKNGTVYAECAVRKDAGDDYDVTDGILIVCRAEFTDTNKKSGENPRGDHEPGSAEETGNPDCLIQIEGGRGVGRVTKRGLNQPTGQAAINSVPRKMISEAVRQILEEAGEGRPVKITVSVPEGERIAEKTFNPVLGITGGISILGTTGIVEPMSEDALVETIHAHLRVLAAGGQKFLAAVPGNMGGEAFVRYIEACVTSASRPVSAEMRFGKEEFVLCSNFIGKTVDLAAECGFSGILIAGHLGKLVKLGNGIMNTHSREGDGRMDTLISCGLAAGADLLLLRQVQQAVTTEEAVELYRESGFLEPVLKILLDRIHMYLKRRAPEQMKVGVLLFSLDTGYLGETQEAREIIDNILAEHGQTADMERRTAGFTVSSISTVQ